jgi:hypothetical protein
MRTPCGSRCLTDEWLDTLGQMILCHNFTTLYGRPAPPRSSVATLPVTGKAAPAGLPSAAVSQPVAAAYGHGRSRARESAGAAHEEPNMPVVKPVSTYPPLASVDDVDNVGPTHDMGCRGTCAFDAATAWHHRILRRIESDQDVLLELIELAVTWPELEYSDTPTIAPEDWMPFVESHHWADPARVERIFSVATDVAMTAIRATRQGSRVPDNHLGQVGGTASVAVADILMDRRDEADVGPVICVCDSR